MDRQVPSLGKRDHTQGPLDAAVELIEYGDYECPYCKAAFPVVKLIQKQFGNDLCFAYRHFPLVQVHPLAIGAAEAAESAGAQGRFWQMHDLLFEYSPRLEIPDLVAMAAALGLDLKRFEAESPRAATSLVHFPNDRSCARNRSDRWANFPTPPSGCHDPSTSRMAFHA